MTCQTWANPFAAHHTPLLLRRCSSSRRLEGSNQDTDL
ncbi:unnamed protein product [Ectocarpus sp. 8 AP-2014]